MVSLFAGEKEILWQPRKDVWNSTSPILFPVVGRLLHNGLWDGDHFYPIPSHGFIRNQEFSLVTHHEKEVSLRHVANQATLAIWPFNYMFEITYGLLDERVDITYSVANIDNRPFVFSLGSHPGFSIPIASQSGWTVRFSPTGCLGPYKTVDRTLDTNVEAGRTGVFPLTSEAFESGAIYFADATETRAQVVNPVGQKVLELTTQQQPWLALWSVPGYDLLCIEPLDGTTDSPTFDGRLEHKRGVRRIDPGQTLCQQYSIAVI